MIRVKAGVLPHNLIIAAAMANEGAEQGQNIVITSGTNGTHMTGSKHYTGDALDMRTSNFPTPSAMMTFVDGLRKRLGGDYDVVVEKDHLHCEYDPK